MTYLVLARKYRPKTFDDVAGQPAVAQTLKNALRLDRIAHAYLFAGPRGVGKTSLARILARALCCEKGPTPDPCGECDRCRSILQGSDLDVVEIDAASNRGIDDVRALRERARVAPMLGSRKLYIVDEAHQLTNEAFNALLKILEEPPRHVVFVLATTEPEKLPETIRSRCQAFEFRRVSDSEIQKRLAEICRAEAIDAPDDALEAIARAARGGVRDSQSLLDQVITHGGGKVTLDGALAVIGALGRKTVESLLAAVQGGDVSRVIAEVDRLDRAGVAAESVIDALLDPLRERLHDAAAAGKAGADFDRLLAIMNLLMQGRRRVRDHDDPRLALELALLRAARFADALPLAEAIASLRGALPDVSGAEAADLLAGLTREAGQANPAVGAFLAGFRALGLRGDELEVAPMRAGASLYSLADPKVRAIIEDSARKACGRPLHLRVAAAGPSSPPVPGEKRLVDRAIEMFEGQRID